MTLKGVKHQCRGIMGSVTLSHLGMACHPMTSSRMPVIYLLVHSAGF